MTKLRNTVGEGNWITSQTVYNMYPTFLESMGELPSDDRPRKPIDVPESQFNFGGDFGISDLQSEQFRFMSSGSIDVRYGSRQNLYWLSRWQPEPLSL